MESSIHNPDIEKFLQDVELAAGKHSLREYVIVASYISPGVKEGAEGFIIVNGHGYHIPPRGPDDADFLRARMAVAVASFDMASLVPDVAAQKEIKKIVVETFPMAVSSRKVAA